MEAVGGILHHDILNHVDAIACVTDLRPDVRKGVFGRISQRLSYCNMNDSDFEPIPGSVTMYRQVNEVKGISHSPIVCCLHAQLYAGVPQQYCAGGLHVDTCDRRIELLERCWDEMVCSLKKVDLIGIPDGMIGQLCNDSLLEHEFLRRMSRIYPDIRLLVVKRL